MTQKMDLGQALGLAFAHMDGGRVAEARKLARTIEKARSDAPGLTYLLGLIALAEGQGRKAAFQLTKALTATPDVPPLLLAMGKALVMQDKFNEAEAYFRRLPGNIEAEADLAALLLRRQDWTGAADLLRGKNLRASGWNNLGVAELSLGNAEAAAMAFARAIDQEPGYARAHANLAGVLRRLKRIPDAHDSALMATRLNPADPAGWIELGQAFRDMRRPDDAIAALSQVRGSAEADWLRGEILEKQGRTDEAAAAYRRVLKQDKADSFGAALALARLEGGQAPARASGAFVAALYDRYADVFDKDLREGLHYRGPELLAEIIHTHVGDGPFTCLDLGCGTGLVGAVMQSVLTRIDGIDLSAAMIEKARERGIYTELTVGEITDAAQRPQAYDLITAADVLIYLGDLAPTFAAAATALRLGGIFAFSVEKLEGEQNYAVQPSKRFAHSADYLRQQAENKGFTVLAIEENWTRTENGRELPGLICLLRKA